MNKYEVEIEWDASSVIVEAESEGEAERLAFEQLGQPEPMEVKTTMIEEAKG